MFRSGIDAYNKQAQTLGTMARWHSCGERGDQTNQFRSHRTAFGSVFAVAFFSGTADCVQAGSVVHRSRRLVSQEERCPYTLPRFPPISVR